MTSAEDPAVSRYFNKRYNAAYLQAVLSSSALTTGQFVSQLLGGRLFRVQHDYVAGKKVCPTFTDLPKAPDELLGVWESQVSKIQDGALSGLYFEYCTTADECEDRTLKNPTILIDDARDRWTLVHEMMHYNFDRERKRDINSLGEKRLEQDAAAAKTAIYESYVHYLDQKDHESLLTLEKNASWLIRTFTYQTLVRGIFEEAATEAMLLDEFEKGTLLNVSPLAAENAASYLEYATQKGTARFDEIVYHQSGMAFSLKSLARFVQSEAERSGWADINAESTDDLRFISDLVNEAGRIAVEAPRGLPSRDVTKTGLLSDSEWSALKTHLSELPGTRSFTAWQRR